MILRSASVLTILLGTTWAFGLPEGTQPLTADELAAVKETVTETLRPLKPAKGRNPPRTSRPAFTLWGDLFGDGKIFAILHGPKDTTAYAEWQKDHWEFRSAWTMDGPWWTRGAEFEDQGHFQEPFVLKDVNGDGVADLLIAFNNDGYRSSYAIAIYSKATGTLRLLDEESGFGEPDFRSGYLVTHHASGRKAWWGEDSFYRWKGDALEWKATWRHDCTPPEHESTRAFIVTVPGSKSGGKASYLIEDGGGENDHYDFLVKRGEKQLGTIRFHYHVPKSDKDFSFENALLGAEPLWLFEAFTGLSWRAAGKDQTNGRSAEESKRFQKFFKVEVTGTPELLELLNLALKTLNASRSK